MLALVLQSMRPHHAVLGRVAGTAVYRSLRNYPDARPPPRTLIFRYTSIIYMYSFMCVYTCMYVCIYLFAVLGRVNGTAVYRSFRNYPDAKPPPKTRIFWCGLYVLYYTSICFLFTQSSDESTEPQSTGRCETIQMPGHRHAHSSFGINYV